MAPRRSRAAKSQSELMSLYRVIAAGEAKQTLQLLNASPALAREAISVGATRGDPTNYFLKTIGHYIYAGDTALHVAAAAYRHDIATQLIARGADVRARNRRGAEPLHYAADGSPVSAYWHPQNQAATIAYLIREGADPNAVNANGVT